MKFLVSTQDSGGFKQISCVNGTNTSRKDTTQPKSITPFYTEISKQNHIIQFEVVQDTFLVAIRKSTLCIYDLLSDNYDLLREVSLPKTPICFRDLGDDLDAVVVCFAQSAYIVSLDPDVEPVEVDLANKNISDLAVNPAKPGQWAFGGKELDVQVVQVWKDEDDFAKQKFKVKSVFKAKNSPPNHLDIEARIWPNRISWLPGDGCQLVVGTGYGELRVYKSNKKKAPVHDWKVSPKAIISLTVVDEGEAVIITNSQSLVAKYSLTKIDPKGYKEHSASAGDLFYPIGKLLGKYSAGGNTGAVYGVSVYEKIVATGGLDRYLRVFDLNTRALKAQVYMGLEVSDVIVLDGDDTLDDMDEQSQKEATKREREEEEDDEVWSALEKKRKM